jgi:hypothetical protein
MIFVGKLSIVDFNFGFRRSESETGNMLRPTCMQKSSSLSHCFGLN